MRRTTRIVATTGLALGLVFTGTGWATSQESTDESSSVSADEDKATESPGIGSGNLVQAPVHVPVNATGNSANVVGALNPTFDDASSND